MQLLTLAWDTCFWQQNPYMGWHKSGRNLTTVKQNPTNFIKKLFNMPFQKDMFSSSHTSHLQWHYLAFPLSGNGLVLFVIGRYRFLQTTNNMFVAVLAAVDSAMTITVILHTISIIQPNVFTGVVPCLLKLIIAISNCISSSLALLGKYDLRQHSHQWSGN